MALCHLIICNPDLLHVFLHVREPLLRVAVHKNAKPLLRDLKH